MRYTSIGYQLTDKCNAACKGCCESANPQLNGKLDIGLILKSIDSIKDIEDIKNIGLTGGEPFLYVEDVLTVAEACKKINRNFVVTTNAFWGESYEYAFGVLSQLKKNNLSSIVVSVDSFHSEYISVESVKNVLNACMELGIVRQIQATSTKSSLSQTDEILAKLGQGKMDSVVVNSSLLPVGRAKENINPEDFFTRKLLKAALCHYQNGFFIAVDGKAVPCCSPSCFGIPFNFGNIYNNSIKEILENMYENKLMRTIISEGFSNLLKIAKEKWEYIESNEYVNVCHLCHDLLCDSERYNYLQKTAETLVKVKENIRSWAK
ncbi:MAG: radical SAM protein [Defluviitaleaceae bacterium]|nr:radical SAM protein [Defluviitaleaceae bacterium]